MTSVNILRLISELEGSYQLTKYMGFKEDMDTLERSKRGTTRCTSNYQRKKTRGIETQLVERLLCKQDVIGSSPLFSTPCEGIAKKGGL